MSRIHAFGLVFNCRKAYAYTELKGNATWLGRGGLLALPMTGHAHFWSIDFLQDKMHVCFNVYAMGQERL